MRANRLYTLPLIALSLLSCAMRDNEYDPLSPLHKSPHLAVAVVFDSSHAHYSKGDTLVVQAPFSIIIKADSRDFFDDTRQPSVSMKYYLDSELQIENNKFTSDTFTLVKKGCHNFTFISSSENGATSTERLAFNLSTPPQPVITCFASSYDTLPVGRKLPVDFYVKCIDPGLVADSLVYVLSTLTQPVHRIATPRDTLRDTLRVTSFYSDSAYTQTVMVHLFDKIGRHDSLSTTITFSKNKTIICGAPPVIDTMFIANELPVLYVDQAVQFIGNAHDTDGIVTAFAWDFGDGDFSSRMHPYHAFDKSGDFKVTLKVTDDSLNTASRSMTIRVKKLEVIKPTFSYFTVKNDSGPSPLTSTIVVVANDKDGFIKYINLSLNGKLMEQVWSSYVSKEITLKTPGTHEVEAIICDNGGNICRETRAIVVTDVQ